MEKIYENLISIPEKIAILAKEKPDDSAIIASDRILTYRNLEIIKIFLIKMKGIYPP